MTRMTREFSFVLLGASALSAGYFLWPEHDFEKRAEEQAHKRVGGTYVPHGLIWVHAGGSPVRGGKPVAVAGVTRGGFGQIGARVSGGGGGGRLAGGVRAVGRIGG